MVTLHCLRYDLAADLLGLTVCELLGSGSEQCIWVKPEVLPSRDAAAAGPWTALGVARDLGLSERISVHVLVGGNRNLSKLIWST